MADLYFTPRELDVMSILWRLGSATVAEVRDALAEPLAYTSVLSALQTLTDKGFVRHQGEGRAYRYFPTVNADAAGGSAIDRIREAIFAGSSARLFATLVSDAGLPREELERMRRLLDARLADTEGDA
jgi:BlaI family transcriptional regulator, penicillinase repressor